MCILASFGFKNQMSNEQCDMKLSLELARYPGAVGVSTEGAEGFGAGGPVEAHGEVDQGVVFVPGAVAVGYHAAVRWTHLIILNKNK